MRDKNIQNSDGNRAPGIRLIEATTEDNPCFQHFTKEEILEDRPDMPRINYDPFAYAQPDDFVHREIVGRDYTLRAVVEGPEGCMMAESSFIYQRHAFEVTKVTESPTATRNLSNRNRRLRADDATEDRLDVLAKVREMFARRTSDPSGLS